MNAETDTQRDEFAHLCGASLYVNGSMVGTCAKRHGQEHDHSAGPQSVVFVGDGAEACCGPDEGFTIRQPRLRVTYVIEQGMSLRECVSEAENALMEVGAGKIISCETAGNDEDGWYVTVVGEGRVRS